MLRRILNQATRRRGRRPGVGAGGPRGATRGSAGKTRGAGSLLRGLSKRRRGL